MIISVVIRLSDLASLGRSFPWAKPNGCPCCSASLWGHGYVFSGGLFLKRYRCRACNTIITLKPSGFWRKYRTSALGIYQSLRRRLTRPGVGQYRQRQRENHWLSKFISFVRMLYGDGADETMSIVALLDHFFEKEIPFLA